MKCENEEILNNEENAQRIILEDKFLLDANDKKIEYIKRTEKSLKKYYINLKIRYENSSLKYFLYTFFTILLMGILVFLLNIIIESNIFSNNNIFAKSDKAIKQSKSDYKKYRTLYLKNGLQAIIISDPLTTISGASLSVRVGATSDPPLLQGLAHFCEHMLFLGSQKYPNGDDYFKTVTENNGHSNAYTDREMTNYFFDIHYLSFENALDVFSRFFIDPIFKEDKVNKEINSVNSEYEKNLIIDMRKKAQIFAYLSEPTDPLHRFTTGNIESLVKSAEKNGLNLRDELLKFHNKYYTSDKMKLIIYTNEELDDIEDLIIEKFSPIKPSQVFLDSLNIKNANLNKNNTEIKFNLKKENYMALLEQPDKLFSENNINPIEKYSFQSPFNKDTMGSLISYESHNVEYDLTITFIQKSLRSHEYYKINPSHYFSFIFNSKEDKSLIDILKKENLATKLNTITDREYDKWSDFSIELFLTKNGIANLDKVFNLITNYLEYVRANFINEEYFNYLKEIEDLKFREKNPLSQNIYEIVSKMGSRAHHYPVSYILYQNIFEGNFNKDLLEEYAKNLDLTNSIIFIPTKNFDSVASKFDFLIPKEKNYEPWYKTSFQAFKVDFEKLYKENKESKSFAPPMLFEKESITKILNNTFICDKNCILKLKKFNTKEPDLLNKTGTFEIWHKDEFTLDFNKMQMELQFVYDTYKNPEEKVYLNLFQTHLRRKLKKFNSKIKAISSGISVSLDNSGIKLNFMCLNNKEIIQRLFSELSSKIVSAFNLQRVIEFNLILQETKDHVKKEYNSQPFTLAYDYLKDNILEDYIRLDQELEILKSVNLDKFKEFISNFEKKLYFKFLFLGSINEKDTRNLFEEFKDLISKPVPAPTKKIFSIKEKRLKRRPILKMDNGNYLLRKIYHNSKNKNNCLLKCYLIDKKNYKKEILTKLFHGIIGNIIFRELRIKRQFGYIAKSRIEIFNDQIFYCIFVQGSSKLPNVIDDATDEVIKQIRNNINSMSDESFQLSKRKNFDIIASSRFDLNKVANRYFNTIIGNKYNFYNLLNMDNYSKSITKEDFMNFFEKTFNSENSLTVTVYMYSKNNKPADMKLDSNKYNNYEELVDENDANDVMNYINKEKNNNNFIK